MSPDTTTQIIVTIGTIGGTVAAVVKYLALQTKKREQALLDHTKETQSMMLEYFEKKNGHMERMANSFTKAVDRNTKIINKLAIVQAKNNK